MHPDPAYHFAPDPDPTFQFDADPQHCLQVLIFCTQVEFYPHHGYLNISLTVWLGIYLFFIIERCLKIFMDSKARRRGETVGGRHSHHALPAKELENLLGSSVGTAGVFCPSFH
jgi:hypothetical protein